MSLVENTARRLRQVYHGRKRTRPMWKDMDHKETEGWIRLAKFVLKLVLRPPF